MLSKQNYDQTRRLLDKFYYISALDHRLKIVLAYRIDEFFNLCAQYNNLFTVHGYGSFFQAQYLKDPISRVLWDFHSDIDLLIRIPPHNSCQTKSIINFFCGLFANWIQMYINVIVSNDGSLSSWSTVENGFLTTTKYIFCGKHIVDCTFKISGEREKEKEKEEVSPLQTLPLIHSEDRWFRRKRDLRLQLFKYADERGLLLIKPQNHLENPIYLERDWSCNIFQWLIQEERKYYGMKMEAILDPLYDVMATTSTSIPQVEVEKEEKIKSAKLDMDPPLKKEKYETDPSTQKKEEKRSGEKKREREQEEGEKKEGKKEEEEKKKEVTKIEEAKLKDFDRIQRELEGTKKKLATQILEYQNIMVKYHEVRTVKKKQKIEINNYIQTLAELQKKFDQDVLDREQVEKANQIMEKQNSLEKENVELFQKLQTSINLYLETQKVADSQAKKMQKMDFMIQKISEDNKNIVAHYNKLGHKLVSMKVTAIKFVSAIEDKYLALIDKTLVDLMKTKLENEELNLKLVAPLEKVLDQFPKREEVKDLVVNYWKQWVGNIKSYIEQRRREYNSTPGQQRAHTILADTFDDITRKYQ